MQDKPREASLQDIPVLVALFRDSVLHTCGNDYTPAQLTAWAHRGTPERFAELFAEGLCFYLAEAEGSPAGFSSVSPRGYLHSLFVARAFQRRGIARDLTARAVAYARLHRATEVTTHASITALPFFRSLGFDVVQEQVAMLDGISLKNYLMRLPL